MPPRLLGATSITPLRAARPSPGRIATRWETGYRDSARVLAQAPWTRQFGPLDGFILHGCAAGEILAEG